MTRGEMFARALPDLGCGLALDDFGTGFGSFTYLKKLPLTHLKIDTEFVRDLDANPANRHVVRAIVSLARAFGLRTIAEGVEDEETLTHLRAEGVDFAQGFHTLVVEAARARDIETGSPADQQLSRWLSSRPSVRFFERTLRTIRAVLESRPEPPEGLGKPHGEAAAGSGPPPAHPPAHGS